MATTRTLTHNGITWGFTSDVYQLRLPDTSSYYVQMVWVNSTGFIDSTNALKISRSQNY